MAATPAPSETGKVAVVTGATSGLGREIARGLAVRGYRTVVVGRDAPRTISTAAALSDETGSREIVPLPVGDLAARAVQRDLVGRLRALYPSIELLVNNAGGIFARREVTPDGLERTFALNVLAPFVLTDRLAASLRASGRGRVVNIASAAHRGRQVELDDLQSGRRYSGWRAYGRSKLELILLTREFAARFGPAGPAVNAVHPGFVRTGFAQNNGGLFAGAVRVAARIGGRSIARGADTPLFVATDPSVAAVTGAYFADRRIRPGSIASQDRSIAARLYEACERLAAA